MARNDSTKPAHLGCVGPICVVGIPDHDVPAANVAQKLVSEGKTLSIRRGTTLSGISIPEGQSGIVFHTDDVSGHQIFEMIDEERTQAPNSR